MRLNELNRCLSAAGRLLGVVAAAVIAIPVSVFAEANYVYHERTTADPGCGGNYVTTLNPNSAQTYPLRFKVEFQNFINTARVYYTTDGTTPFGAFGVGGGTTLVVPASFVCTFGGPVVDVWTATIPAQPAGTVVKYIVSAWHTGGGAEIFGNGPGAPCACGTPTSSSALATVQQYTVLAQTVIVESHTSGNVKTANPPFNESAGSWATTTGKSTAAGLTGVGAEFASSGTPAFQVIPTLVSGTTYIVDVTHTTAANNCSPDIVVGITQSGCSGLPASTTGFAATNGANAWYAIGYVTPTVAAPTITFTYQSGTLASTGGRFYADAVRFRPVTNGASILWSVAGSSAWLTAANWTGSLIPGAAEVAQFGANPTAATGAGINMNTAGANVQQAAAIEVTSARSSVNMLVGNSSGTAGASGTLQLLGSTINSVPNTVLRNNGSGTTVLTLQNTQGSGNQGMYVSFVTQGSAVIDATKDITISSIIRDANNGFTKIGSGKLTLSAADTYTGDTIVSAGTLALGAGGSMANTPNIKVAGGSTFDVSAVTFSLGAAQTLTCTGAGTATIVGNVTMVSGAKAAFDVVSGTAGKFSDAGLTLNNNIITINVSGAALGGGTYRLIDYTGTKSGSFNATPTIAGLGLVGGFTATVTEDTVNKHIDLVVASSCTAHSSLVQATSARTPPPAFAPRS